uniref:Uncharacterized protein n=1 Tax=Solanum tuberosum TaxID=4113 RepID=M1D8A6_SOLTU
MLHGPKCTTLASVGLFEGRHHAVTNETEMNDPNLKERVMRWISGQIAIKRESATWANIPPNKLVDKWVETPKVIETSKIKNASNHLYGSEAASVGPLKVVRHMPIEILRAERGLEQGESS